MLTLSTEDEGRLVSAKAFEWRNDLNDTSTFVLPALSKGESRTKNLCLEKLTKRRQLLEQIVPRELMKIRNLEFSNDRVKVAIETSVSKNWQAFLNVLQINAISFVNFDRPMKVANAKTLSHYKVVCFCKTCSNEKMESVEVPLQNYTL